MSPCPLRTFPRSVSPRPLRILPRSAQPGRNGFLVRNVSELMIATARIFALSQEDRVAMWAAAQARAVEFSYPSFEKKCGVDRGCLSVHGH